MGQAPIFHVNGDDPEAAVRVVRWALAFRQAFQKDVVIDMVCYRRHGHNEGDEPSYTQPRLYARIQKHPPVAALYAEKLLREGTVTEEEVRGFREGAGRCLDLSFERAQTEATAMKPAPIEVPKPLPGAAPVPRATNTAPEVLARITEAVTSAPPDVDVHPKLKKGMAERRRVMESGEGIDWAFAEALALGSLVLEKVPVRLSGQDSVRGTFSQRHLLLVDDDTDASWMALQHLAPDQAPMNAIDSPLSELAVMGFEFGYSVGNPTALVMWEAQFGDFANGAQTVIDQFVAGSKAKWGQPSGLVLLLPHGYEGQGPDHSSARPERFLSLAAEENLVIVNASTPAQYFHVVRRQVCEGIRKPLVIFTPKSLLRHPRARSTVRDLTEERFHPVLADPAGPDPARVKRLLLCTGKVYYDLEDAREKSGRSDAAIYRIEQLYPFPETEIREALSVHRGAEVIWVQEEPRNMGAWHFMHDRLAGLRGQEVSLRYVGRKESASTATGYHDVHAREQQTLVAEALGL
jgi:2-oxoglutarate dehydrogenase E1 component